MKEFEKIGPAQWKELDGEEVTIDLVKPGEGHWHYQVWAVSEDGEEYLIDQWDEPQ